jgi:hypothetical protein
MPRIRTGCSITCTPKSTGSPPSETPSRHLQGLRGRAGVLVPLAERGRPAQVLARGMIDAGDHVALIAHRWARNASLACRSRTRSPRCSPSTATATAPGVLRPRHGARDRRAGVGHPKRWNPAIKRPGSRGGNLDSLSGTQKSVQNTGSRLGSRGIPTRWVPMDT